MGIRNILLSTLGAVLAAGAVALSGSAAQAQADKVFVMKLSTATINDTQHEWLKRFAALVEKDFGGRIKPEIYAASQLGSIPRQIEGTQFGSIQAWMGPPEFLVGVDERFEAMTAPGLFTDHDQVMRVMLESGHPEDGLWARCGEGTTGLRLCDHVPFVDSDQEVDQATLRTQGPEDPRAGVAVPA